ncbi:MAG TPA: hypothetical protein VF883_23365 [Thermoanaerobaculia bacterium]
MKTSMQSSIIRVATLVIMTMAFAESASAQRSRLFERVDRSELRAATNRLVRQIARNELEGTVGDGSDPKSQLLDLSPAVTAEDFSQESRRALQVAFQLEPSKENLLLVGLTGADMLVGEVETHAAEPIKTPASGMFYGTLPWAANLVRARHGDKASAGRVLDVSREADVELQVVFLLRELAYVPQPEIAEYIAAFVFSEGRVEPVKSTVEGILYAQYAAAALSRMLEGCPVPYKEDYSYSRKEIETLRAWLSRDVNGDWRFRNSDRSR